MSRKRIIEATGLGSTIVDLAQRGHNPQQIVTELVRNGQRRLGQMTVRRFLQRAGFRTEKLRPTEVQTAFDKGDRTITAIRRRSSPPDPDSAFRFVAYLERLLEDMREIYRSDHIHPTLRSKALEISLMAAVEGHDLMADQVVIAAMRQTLS